MFEQSPGISMADDLWPHAQSNAALYGVSPLVHQQDFMWQWLLDASKLRDNAVRKYFSDGDVSARKVAELLYDQLGVSREKPLRFFEFASGYGMVTRHLPRFFPNGGLLSCDIHPEAVDFLNAHIGVRAVLSQAVPEDLAIEEKADIVFALSFFSHMPAGTFGRWLRTLYDVLAPGGYLVFTTHGRISIETIGIADDIPPEGSFFKPVSEQADLDTNEYGAMFVTVQWVIDELWKHVQAPLAFYREAYWWGHQDVYVVAKL